MTDFKAMTDDELRRWIAERLGYDEITVVDGEELWGKHPLGAVHIFSTLPNWPGSVDAALALVDRNLWNVEVSVGWEMSECSLDNLVKTYWAKSRPETPARAICVAWAQMMEAEND